MVLRHRWRRNQRRFPVDAGHRTLPDVGVGAGDDRGGSSHHLRFTT